MKSHKGMAQLNLRELSIDKLTGELKPGRKSISLTAEQYKELKSCLREIDAVLADIE
jgi:Transcriptional Coactivator p15 (PC4)